MPLSPTPPVSHQTPNTTSAAAPSQTTNNRAVLTPEASACSARSPAHPAPPRPAPPHLAPPCQQRTSTMRGRLALPSPSIRASLAWMKRSSWACTTLASTAAQKGADRGQIGARGGEQAVRARRAGGQEVVAPYERSAGRDEGRAGQQRSTCTNDGRGGPAPCRLAPPHATHCPLPRTNNSSASPTADCAPSAPPAPTESNVRPATAGGPAAAL